MFALGKYEDAASEAHTALHRGKHWKWKTLGGHYAKTADYSLQLRALENSIRQESTPEKARYSLRWASTGVVTGEVPPVPAGLSAHATRDAGKHQRPAPVSSLAHGDHRLLLRRLPSADALLLVIWACVSYGLGVVLVEPLNAIKIRGFPLGFWFAQQGSIYVFIVLIAVYAVAMDRLDRRYGVDK